MYWLLEYFIIIYSMKVNLVKFWSVICDGLYEVILYLGGEGR